MASGFKVLLHIGRKVFSLVFLLSHSASPKIEYYRCFVQLLEHEVTFENYWSVTPQNVHKYY